MSEEKRTFYKTLNNIVATNRIDNEEAYIINNYVSGLENIIKEVREIFKDYGEKEDIVGYTMYNITGEMLLKLLEIIDKENKQ